MKSGIVKKTTSYIMGIPMNDADVNTPEMVYERIRASEEFELLKVEFDDKNICPMVTVGYRDMEFLVDIRIESVDAIAPDFMFCHPMPDECIKKIKQAQIGVTTFLTFNDDILASHHFQLKFLKCIVPELAAVVDFNVRRIFSPVWLKQFADSKAAPGPGYIFSINSAPDKNGNNWMFTQGLNRCGFMELEVLNAPTDNLDFYGNILSITGSKAITENIFPDEMERFDIASLPGGKSLSVTWRYWKGEVSVYGDEILGSAKNRPKNTPFNGMLFVWDIENNSKKPVRASDMTPFSIENAVVEFSPEENRRIEILSQETIDLFRRGFDIPETRALVKIKMKLSEKTDEDGSYEYVWAEVDSLDKENVFGTAIQDSAVSDTVKKDEKIQASLSSVSDWILNIKGGRVTPDTSFMLAEK
ncbi:MAG: DUF4026 domain-containing protein [Oscillospiraceae bacterium]|nr:DUF4026 domain-containing protein [Oscillospiraceae bacterium]